MKETGFEKAFIDVITSVMLSGIGTATIAVLSAVTGMNIIDWFVVGTCLLIAAMSVLIFWAVFVETWVQNVESNKKSIKAWLEYGFVSGIVLFFTIGVIMLVINKGQ